MGKFKVAKLFKKKEDSIDSKRDLAFLSPDGTVHEIEKVDTVLQKQIEQAGVDKFLQNLNLSSLFVQDSEPQGFFQQYSSYVIIGLQVLAILVFLFKK